MSRRLEGKVALVTGAGSTAGMGFAIARRFLAEGAAVMMTDIDADGVIAAATSLGGPGTSVEGRCHDVTDAASWQDAIAATVGRFGGLDILVNNAGLALTRSIAETSVVDFDRITAVNLRGVFLGGQHAAPEMRRRGGGAIVNMSSVAGLAGVAYNAVYSATKGGVRLLSKSFALELAKDNIRCNSVHPGVIDTGMVRAVIDIEPANSAAIIGAIPAGRLGCPDDVANCVLYLASDEAAYVTGGEFAVDGGLSAQ